MPTTKQDNPTKSQPLILVLQNDETSKLESEIISPPEATEAPEHPELPVAATKAPTETPLA